MCSYCTIRSVGKFISYSTFGLVRYRFFHATCSAMQTLLLLPQRDIPYIFHQKDRPFKTTQQNLIELSRSKRRFANFSNIAGDFNARNNDFADFIMNNDTYYIHRDVQYSSDDLYFVRNNKDFYRYKIFGKYLTYFCRSHVMYI